jgi:hypothetical protein
MAQTPQISQMAISTAEELIAATRNKKVTEINVSADLADLSPLRLMPGQTLRSASDRHAVLSFRPDADGLEVTTDNSVFGLDVRVAPTHRAIWNDRTVDSLGTLHPICPDDRVRSDHGDRQGPERTDRSRWSDIRFADTRGERERPWSMAPMWKASEIWDPQ